MDFIFKLHFNGQWIVGRILVTSTNRITADSRDIYFIKKKTTSLC